MNSNEKINSKLNEFFKAERKRVIEPDPYFASRVVARLPRSPAKENGFWDSIFIATRPVFAVGLVLLVAFLTLHILIPVQPRRGPVDAYLAPQQTPGERFLFTGEAASPETLERLVVLEESQ